MLLQRRAPGTIRRHLIRDAMRVTVLMAGDLVVFGFLGALLRMARSGFPFSDMVRGVFPVGFLGGSQFALALVLSLLIVGAYRPGDRRRDVGRLFAGSALATGLILYQPLWHQDLLLILVQFAATATAFGIALTVERLLLDLLVMRLKPWGVERRVVAVHGGADHWVPSAMAEPTNGSGKPDWQVVGTVGRPDGSRRRRDAPLEDLGAVIETTNADTVIVCGPICDEDFAFVVDTALVSGCRLLAASRTARVAAVEPKGVWVRRVPLVELTAPGLKGWQLAGKRLIDLLAASVGLVLLASIFGVIAIAVRASSRGPVFFKQWRVGRGGKPFEIYKFRSMISNAEQRVEELRHNSIYADKRLFKVVDDPRITKVGAFLRKTSIDELPQLINVLRGNMSLVGPRPPLLSEVALYEEHHYCRFDMKPGITGPWQVAGRNRITEFEDVIRLESEYIRNWSIVADVRLLLRTMPVVLRMEGAH
jgi:exopolysaccharide biosynthesis polyprenyl glycosylphosphotransferase